MLDAKVWEEIADDLLQLENELAMLFTAAAEPIKSAATHLLHAGGKRLRPALLFAAAKFGSYRQAELLSAAQALEIVHTASLIHDDIVDRTDRRRGLPAVHQIWGDGTALLVGDYLFAKAFSLLAGLQDRAEIIDLLAEVVGAMAEGEVEQLAGRFNSELTEQDYLHRIKLKTAVFLSACCRLGARLGRIDAPAADNLAAYGENIGMAYQIIDDCLDCTGRQEVLGKPVGSDLRQGIINLPVIRALSLPVARAPVLAFLARIEQGSAVEAAVNDLNNVLAESGALAYTRGKAAAYAAAAKEALRGLPPGPPRELLSFAADALLQRSV
ncbi:MAG: polyprenyl synthetase family protein [bacterium]|jgi:heptaprenyl diphosphate synthase